jgi:uncharacterized membrane protein
LFSIPIPGLVLNFSFAWLPIMILGWYYGPVYGLICGALMDTMIFLIFPVGIWFWMYAIQEPLVGLMAGLISSWCRYRRDKEKINIKVDVAIQQLFYLAFAVICYFTLINWVSSSKTDAYINKAFMIYRWLSLALITTFFLILEFFTIYNAKTNKKDRFRTVTFIYATCLVSGLMLLLSVLLGPISTVSYLTYINGHQPDQWVNVGAVYYLIPRIIIDSIKVPIESFLLATLVLCLDPIIKLNINNISLKWEYDDAKQ